MRRERLLEFDLDPVSMSRRLLGLRLVRVIDGQRVSGRIVEVEAYLGREDKAAHTYGGRRTPRNEAMYAAGGHAYVYFTYGMHHCMNVVCGDHDEGVAVLLRALEPEEGVELMYDRRLKARRDRDLCSGPAKLCQALSIDRSMNGEDLRSSDRLWIELTGNAQFEPPQIVHSARIGVSYAEEWAMKPLRFFVRNSEHVSR